MTLAELRIQAARVLSLEPAGGYEYRTFSCSAGGSPANRAGVPEVHRDDVPAYETVRWGWAYRGSVTVECRDTGAFDDAGRAIYATAGGVVFVFAYSPGGPESFDRGALVPPSFGEGGETIMMTRAQLAGLLFAADTADEDCRASVVDALTLAGVAAPPDLAGLLAEPRSGDFPARLLADWFFDAGETEMATVLRGRCQEWCRRERNP